MNRIHNMRNRMLASAGMFLAVFLFAVTVPHVVPAQTIPETQPESTSAETQPSSEASTEVSTETGTKASGEASREEPVESLYFRIDDSHRYEGMSSSYRDGYLPEVSNGRAILILPLRADGEVSGRRITASPELGGTENSPFVFRNYQQTIEEQTLRVEDSGEEIPLYPVRFELELSPERRNGVYPVMVTVNAKGADGTPVTQTFNSYITITDGKSNEEETGAEVPELSTEAETRPESLPLLYVENSTLTPGEISAGEEFVVKASLRNTSKTQNIRKIVISVSTESDEITLLEQSNTIYWERMKAGENRELPLHFRAEQAIPVGKYHIRLEMSYDNEEAVSMSSSGDIAFSVTQPMRIQGEFPTIASSVNAGDTFTLAFQAVNLGRSAAYNVRFELEADGLSPNGSAYVGNLEGGTAGQAEMKVFAGAKENTDGERYGSTSGTMTMIYENENGKEYREEVYFKTDIQELVIRSASAEPEEETSTSWWWIAAGVVLLAIIGLVITGRRRR